MIKSYANMAQLVEQLIRNQQVAGSNPAISSKKRKDGFFRSFFFSDMTDLNRSSREGVSRRFAEGSRLRETAIHGYHHEKKEEWKFTLPFFINLVNQANNLH